MSAALAPEAMLAEMCACAHRLGMAFGREAEAAQDRAERMALFDLFDRCFFSVRVGVALQLRLRRERGLRPTRGPADAYIETPAVEREAERLREPPERDEPADRPERLDERDRDRETERASLPILLKTLRGVAAEAAARPGPRPAELPSLTALLERFGGEASPPANTPPTPPAPRPAASLRERLARSGAAAILAPPATGPPRR
jgi:hypothetical protein